eukprot:11217677-Alexandrium_andersonii.AAC.1
MATECLSVSVSAPGPQCVSVCLCVSVSVCLWLGTSVSECVSVSLPQCLSVSVRARVLVPETTRCPKFPRLEGISGPKQPPGMGG